MSDTENKAPVEDVQMDAPAAPEEQAPAAETSAEEVKPAEDESKADQDENKKEANGDGAEADKEAPVVDEEKDDNVAANDEDVEAEANEDNEKPVSSKKPKSSKNNGSAAPASSRRKSAGGSKAAVEGNHSFKSGDIVLTRLKGYPPWPSIIVEGDEIPAKVQRAKPSGTRQIASMFFPTGDYAWSLPKELTPLKKHEITAYLQAPSKKKKGDLFAAYEIAEDPKEWLETRASGAGGEDEDMEVEDEDELAEEVDEEPEESAGKKRKRGGEKKASGAADNKAKKAKLEKLAKSKKSKDTVEDEDEAEAVEEPVSKKSAKPKASKKKAEEPKEAEAAEDGEESDPFANDPEAKKVKDWRHRLQRGFLGKSMPATEEMEGYNDLFTAIEDYGGMTVDYLAYSKIGKVMKKIAALNAIPEDGQYKFTDRATTMMSKWQTQVEQNQAA
ncbi:hypothetical protein HD553DRAFT_303285 [Filobasidium floriforme]|uniref:uncharacterized protein n=1 Tax=Filobasidium floriforme TaxID=5210 RepID=UPI001E8D92E3|nr:uncharacterized protein HD553DRAFT_303285 [Filobasidium floriforme]KAH8090758.1 hypothetical protein HD553DRAFT_303285 [Filobasidium floriforme]